MVTTFEKEFHLFLFTLLLAIPCLFAFFMITVIDFLKYVLFQYYWCFILIFLLIFPILYIVLQFRKRDSTSSKKPKKEKNWNEQIAFNNEAKAYTLRWKVEKLSYCWLKEGKSIKSPTFTTDALEGTKWSLELYPKGSSSNSDSVSVFLKREKDYCGPEVIELKYHISFLGKNGLILNTANLWGDRFKKDYFGIQHVNEKRDKIFETERNTFLSDDTLRIQCKLWKENEKPIVSELLSARTMFRENRGSFVWRVNNFGSFYTFWNRGVLSFLVRELGNGFLELDFCIDGNRISRKSLIIDCSLSNDGKYLFSFTISIIDSYGAKINCGNQEYCSDDLLRNVSFELPFTRNMLIENSREYLPKGILSFYFEYNFSTATSLYECCSCSTPSSVVIQEIDESENEIRLKKSKSKLIPVLQKDLKFLYMNPILCDVKLHTSTKTFSAHKAILSARSVVFQTMFCNDKKGKNSEHVDLSGFDDETVHRMLTFIYTDSLEDLQIEGASKLYTAAAKYDISSLKLRCSSLLSENLSPITVCGVLVLADVHQDDDLKDAVKKYIMIHDKEVFDTQEWKHFITTHLSLAAEVMLRKVPESSN